ncbi:MAG TPA: hypothetical protein VNS63_20850 [Blastocatellia bacterium]|nr:hypothetical protein [Blastocatellia bacterium]
MKCFNHDTSEAVAVCKNCGKALCHSCAADVGNGIACVNHCEQEVRALNEMIGRNRSASGKASGAYYKNAVVFALLSLVLVYLAVDAFQTRRTPLLVLTGGTALVFLLAAFFSYSTGRKFIKGGR